MGIPRWGCSSRKGVFVVVIEGISDEMIEFIVCVKLIHWVSPDGAVIYKENDTVKLIYITVIFWIVVTYYYLFNF